MKASLLYVGEYYAWSSTPKKGKFTPYGRRVRLRNTETRKVRYEKNARTLAHITVVETERELVVPAREILGFWDDYKREADLIERDKQAHELERKRKMARHTITESMLAWALQERTGMMTVGNLKFSPYGEEVTFSSAELQRWLRITEAQIEAAVTKHMEGPANEES